MNSTQDVVVLLQAVLEFPLACGISTGTPVRVGIFFEHSLKVLLVSILHSDCQPSAYHGSSAESSEQVSLSAV